MENAEPEREEGEIVDDELEDVSDCSIASPFHLGKCVSATERLRSVSLSSISDSELEAGSPRKNGHYVHILKSSTPYDHHIKPYRKKRKRRHDRNGVDSNSDSEDDKLDRKMLQQLKEAVRIEDSKEGQHNSLRTRLRGLIEPVSEKSHTEDEEVMNNSESNNVENQENSGDITNDKELEELRLEALKSAMLKKHFERKKRKALEQQKNDIEKLEGGDINKENTVDNAITNENKSKNGEVEKNEASIEEDDEDIDIMRAMLLASMSRKITESSKLVKKPPITQTTIDNKPNNVSKPIKRIMKNNYYSNKVVNFAKQNALKPNLPSVEPLIINLNNDSDSDMDIDDDGENDIAKSVSDFLKQQRAEVEAKNAEKQKMSVLNKTAMKLLPFSQQIEYLRLKQQLQAKKVKLLKTAPNMDQQKPAKVQQNVGDVRIRNVKSKMVLRSKFTLVKQNTIKDKIKGVRMNKIERNNTSCLQRTLSDMQTQKDGRLQVKGKYQELAPILKKVNQVSVERKRYENEIKRLLQELEKTKQKYSASHQNFKNLVEELLKRKEAIDKRTTASKEVQKNPVLSTPMKATADLTISKLGDDVILVSSTPTEIKDKPNYAQENHQDSEKKTETDIQDIVDPNDLNEHIMNQNKNLMKTTNLPKYTSPLDKSGGDLLITDPLAMLCPFDLFGVCKDKECTYKHCS